MKYLLIIGAKSDIAMALAREYAMHGFNLYLAGRNIEEIADFKKDLEIRYNVITELKELDITEVAKHKSFYDSLEPKPEGVITAVGYLPDQKIAEKEIEETLKTLYTNFVGVVCFLNIVANDFEERGRGFIIGISSVAGDRGRRRNYIYGCAKAGFTAYLSGLRSRLYPKGIQVLTVNPGFVYTKMTKGMKLPKLLTSTPEDVAKHIFKAQQKGKDILYTKWIWKYIMLIIRHLPEFIFKRLDF